MLKLTIDLHDYIEGGSVFKRIAVRGIIQKDGKYLLIHSKYGDHKFPGGGMKQGEMLEETLIREVQEETGYLVRKESISEGILVQEKRKGEPDDLLEMDSYYFFCDVFDTIGERNLDDYEAEYDYKVSWMTLDQAIENNESVKDYEIIPWIKRETMVMRELIKMDNT
jgi:8-oxo-dGTP pyrophosphatase MutT (NUDIX family)